VLVEMEDTSDYGYGGEFFESHAIGKVLGPFQTEAEARAHGKAINDARGYYIWNGHRHRMTERDFEEREIETP
jgi:hypothetical protein